jgi:hypothetical protein
MLTFDDKGGGGREVRKPPKHAFIRNTWMFPSEIIITRLEIFECCKFG